MISAFRPPRGDSVAGFPASLTGLAAAWGAKVNAIGISGRRVTPDKRRHCGVQVTAVRDLDPSQMLLDRWRS